MLAPCYTKSMAPKARKKSRPLTTKEYIVLGFLSILLLWLIILNLSILKKEERARRSAYGAQEQLSSIQSREKTLEASINELGTERGEEESVRSTFGVAKPGEGEIIVVPPKNPATTTPPSFWQKWFGWAKFW